MTLRIECWEMRAPGEPMMRSTRDLPEPLAADHAVIEVAGCGVCHTDLGFLYDGVRTRHALPLTLGHEIAGIVVRGTGAAAALEGQPVVVPAVIPCGTCDVCKAGRGAICTRQVFPGNDDHGGFASHVVVPARGLCPVDPGRLRASGVELSDLSVVADAVTTPYQAIRNADLRAGDVAIFVGVGGVGAFGVQIAAALGAHVVALDISAGRLELAAAHGAGLTLDAAGDARGIRQTITGWAKERGLPRSGWKIFETSGTAAGQTLAYGLLTFGAHLGVVGYTRDAVSVRLSNLMAFDATARGTWGCLPEHYPAVVDMVVSGKVVLAPFIERWPMGRINEVFEGLRAHTLHRRPILVPDFDGPASI